MKINKLIKEKKAQVVSTDLLLGIIIITVILGFSADAMDIIIYKIQDCGARLSLERIVVDAADSLVKTPGKPKNWEECGNEYPITPGLAVYDDINGETIPNTLSLKKILKLKQNYDLLINNRILPEIAHSSIIINPCDASLKPIIIHDDNSYDEYSDVIIIKRNVLVNLLDSKIVISVENLLNSSNPDNINLESISCPHKDLNGSMKHESYKTSKNTFWVCRYFKLSGNDLNNYDFYLLFDSCGLNDKPVKWIIDSNEKLSDKEGVLHNNPVKVNEELKEILGKDKEAVLWLHVLFNSGQNQSKVYLVSLPKNSNVELLNINYIYPVPCNFIFKVWI
ncbi:MAG: hypothetical protein ACP5C3_08430 [Methanomicrobiales archaeon]